MNSWLSLPPRVNALKNDSSSLKTKGGTLILSPEAFFVKGKEGPLKEGELERAAGWAKGILESKK